MTERRGDYNLAIIVLALLGASIWLYIPKYRVIESTSGKDELVRIHLLTGKTENLTQDGWTTLGDQETSLAMAPRAVPADLRSKITGRGGTRGSSTFSGYIYNGAEEFVVYLAILEIRLRTERGKEPIARKFTFRPKAPIPPLAVADMSIEVGETEVEGWKIVYAEGRRVKKRNLRHSP